MPAPAWVQSSTAWRPRPATATPAVLPDTASNLPTPAPAAPTPEGSATVPAAAVATGQPVSLPLPAAAELPAPPPPLPVLPTLHSPDGRLALSGTRLTVLGDDYGLRELERAEIQHVRWLLWLLLGGLGLAAVLISFLQNRLHTLPAALGLAAAALVLAYGQRGTNRLRLLRLGRQPAHYALPGELDSWQRLVAELNRRIARVQQHAAAEAAAQLAAEAAAQAARQAADDGSADASAPPDATAAV